MDRPVDSSLVSDGYHTFAELYRYRMLYNALWLNAVHEHAEAEGIGAYEDMDIHKSRLHHDGIPPFSDDGWFIVMAMLPTGQVSNHYRIDDWDKFQIPERERAAKWDGHTPEQAADRMSAYLTLTATHEDYR